MRNKPLTNYDYNLVMKRWVETCDPGCESNDNNSNENFYCLPFNLLNILTLYIPDGSHGLSYEIYSINIWLFRAPKIIIRTSKEKEIGR